jgi:predicted regulator of Ras-like GTPase activity (Roadblock/LC7/MglB family)
LGRGVEENYISALSTNALTFIEKIAEELNSGGTVEQMIIKISNSLVIISGIGNEGILTVLANKRTNMGILMTEMAKARERLSGLLLGEVVPLLAEADEKAIRS